MNKLLVTAATIATLATPAVASAATTIYQVAPSAERAVSGASLNLSVCVQTSSRCAGPARALVNQATTQRARIVAAPLGPKSIRACTRVWRGYEIAAFDNTILAGRYWKRQYRHYITEAHGFLEMARAKRTTCTPPNVR